VAYWYLNETSGGYWASKDGTLTGEWSYDTDTTDSGIWWNDAGKYGTWVQDENDNTLKIGYEHIEYLGCVNTIFGVEDDNGEPICLKYWDNPSDCDLQDSLSITAK
jgi:archaellin